MEKASEEKICVRRGKFYCAVVNQFLRLPLPEIFSLLFYKNMAYRQPFYFASPPLVVITRQHIEFLGNSWREINNYFLLVY